MIGVYRITTANGRFYIGSSVECSERLRKHQRMLRHGSHHCPKLQRAWHRTGGIGMTFAIALELSTLDLARAHEQALLDRYFGTPRCLNEKRYVDDAPCRTVLRPPEGVRRAHLAGVDARRTEYLAELAAKSKEFLERLAPSKVT